MRKTVALTLPLFGRPKSFRHPAFIQALRHLEQARARPSLNELLLFDCRRRELASVFPGFRLEDAGTADAELAELEQRALGNAARWFFERALERPNETDIEACWRYLARSRLPPWKLVFWERKLEPMERKAKIRAAAEALWRSRSSHTRSNLAEMERLLFEASATHADLPADPTDEWLRDHRAAPPSKSERRLLQRQAVIPLPAAD